jgi:type VI secretion system secreted protein Hcp
MTRTRAWVAGMPLLFLATAVAAAPLGEEVPGQEAAAAYLKLGGVEGEATRGARGEEIELLSFSWGGAAGRTAGVGTRPPAGPGTLVATKRVDTASPKLMEAIADGTIFPRAELRIRAAREGERYLVIRLENVTIASVRPSASGDEVPTEQVSFAYEKIQ